MCVVETLVVVQVAFFSQQALRLRRDTATARIVMALNMLVFNSFRSWLLGLVMNFSMGNAMFFARRISIKKDHHPVVMRLTILTEAFSMARGIACRSSWFTSLPETKKLVSPLTVPWSIITPLPRRVTV